MHSRSSRSGLLRRAGLVAVAAVTAVASFTGTASADPGPVAPSTLLGSISDGPGQFHVFRTVDSGNRPTAEDTARCNAQYGVPAQYLLVERLDARMYTFQSDPASGVLTAETARNVGPIYVCDGLGLDGTQILDQWGTLDAPGLGRLDMRGPCGFELYPGSPGRGAVDCVLRIQPNASGVSAGVATSNSVANPLRLPGGRTGSVWTLYSLGEGTAPVDSAPPAGIPQPTGPIAYNVTREVNSRSVGSSPSCAGGERTTELHAASVDPATGAASTSPSEITAATARVCYSPTAQPEFGAALTVTYDNLPGGPLTVEGRGQCRQNSLPGIADVQQSCGLTLPPNPARGLAGGQVTINGLVPAGDPAGSANSAIWTTSLLGPISGK